MSHSPGRGEGGLEIPKFKWDIPKNQCKIDPFWVEHFRIEAEGRGLRPSKIENVLGTLILSDPFNTYTTT